MSTLTMKVAQAKNFFFDSEIVKGAVDDATRKNLNYAGNLIKKIAQRSMRKARRKKAGEMTQKETKSFDFRMRLWEQSGKSGPKPKRPFAPSKPGEPPRTRVGLIRKFLYAIYDPSTRTTVIGPSKLSGVKGHDVPSILEYGGTATIGGKNKHTVKIKPRPYMGPAYETTRRDFVEQWRDAVRRN